MKRIILFTLSLLGVMGLQAQSPDLQKSNVKRNHFHFSPFYLFDATFMMSYEHIFPFKGALRVTPSITLSNSLNSTYYSDLKNREGLGIDMGYKFFLSEKPRRVVNPYVGPFLMYKYVKHTRIYYSVSSVWPGDNVYFHDEYHVFGLGVDAGVKFVFGRFTVDATVGGGVRYHNNSESIATDVFDDVYKGIVPRLNLCFGIAL